MKRISGWLKSASVLTALALTSTASATTGYFGIGYGAKSMGMVGAVVSNPQDSLAAATNPAGMGLVGERADFGISFFSPSKRSGKIETTALGATFDVKDESRRNLFLVPNLGFTRKINDKVWWGLSMYGNGGMDSTYDRNLYDEAFAVLGAFGAGGPPAAAMVPEGTRTPHVLTPSNAYLGTLGVHLEQGLIAPTITAQINEKNTFGVSLLIGIQRFSARGLGNFQCFTSTVARNPALNPMCATTGVASTPSADLTNNGNDWSYGAGLRLGWIGEVHPRLTLGLSAASKVYMTEFHRYDDLFAEDGDFDIPANFTVGGTFKATPKLSFSYDYQKIFYEDVASISNAGPVLGPAGPAFGAGSGPLGTDKGLGFGWEDININRVATEYRHNDRWTFRAGYSWNDQPIPNDQVLFNILAPAVIEKHASIGFTYRPNDSSEWNFSYSRALEEEVRQQISPFIAPVEIKMEQNVVDLGYTIKF